MDITGLIAQPENMNKETLYALRSFLAIYPYYQPARLLMLQNLYILHDPSFDEELRRSAVYLTDRKVLFQLIEATHYKLKKDEKQPIDTKKTNNDDNRTISLIDSFLDTIPEETTPEKPKRKPTPADAARDYVSYLLELENEDNQQEQKEEATMKGQSLIDNFISKEGGRITLQDELEYHPQLDDYTEGSSLSDEGYFTETLAKIYIKQGQYEKAIEIIKRLYLNYPKKNVYFADQLRFLDKLILNNKHK